MLLWLDDSSDEIMAVLPDNGNLLYAILYDKPFPKFQEMPAEDKFKLEMILEKVNKDLFFLSLNVSVSVCILLSFSVCFCLYSFVFVILTPR
jgi:hypothetical protein